MKKYAIVFVVFLFVLVSEVNAVYLSEEILLDEVTDTKPSTGNDGLMDSAWPMYCHDARHTGISPYGKEGDYYKILWKFK